MVANIGGAEGLSKNKLSPKIPVEEQTRATREQAGNFLKGYVSCQKGLN